MKNLTYFLLASLFLLASCSGLLDRSPEDALALDEAFERPQDLERGLIAAYSLLSSEPLCGRNQLLFADLMGGNATLNFGDFREIGALQVSPFNSRVLELWQGSYQCINQVNLLLAAMDEVAESYPDFSAEEQARIKGEAYFIRAYLYYQLLQYFARPYAEGVRDSLGVPLMLSPITTNAALQYPPRASVGQVYDQILADLQAAGEALESPVAYGRAGYAAVQALFARIYLQTRRYAEAAQRVLDGPFALTAEPATVYRQEGASEEIWFAVSGTDNPLFAGLNWAYGDAFVSPLRLQQTSLSEEQLQHLQAAGYRAIDLRDTAQAGISDPLLSGRPSRCLKFEDAELTDDAPVFRLAECLLIRAEASLELEDKATAAALLNQLRRRAYRIVDSTGAETANGMALIELSPEAHTLEELWQFLKQERHLELAFEGHYLFDLQRWRQPVRPGIAWDDPRLRLPIPQRELDVNPNLVQNPGY